MYPLEHIQPNQFAAILNKETQDFLRDYGVSIERVEQNMAFGVNLQDLWFKATQEKNPALTPENLEISQTEARIATATYFFYQLKESLFDYDLLQTEYKRLVLAQDIQGQQEIAAELQAAERALQENAVKLRLLPTEVPQMDEESAEFPLTGKFELGFPNVWTNEAVRCRMNLDGTIDIDPEEMLEGTELVKNMIGIYANYSLESRYTEELLDTISTMDVHEIVTKLLFHQPIDTSNKTNAVALDILATINEMWRNLRMARDKYERPIERIQTIGTIVNEFAEEEDMTMNDSERVYTKKYNELMKDWYQFAQIRAQLKRIRVAA